jgi:hypothetical protein
VQKLLYLFILISMRAFSQSFEKGPEIKIGDDQFFDRIIGEDKSHFYTLRFDIKYAGKFYFLEQYSKITLKKIKAMELGKYMMEDEINVGQDVIRSYNRVITFICVLKEKFYVFSKLYNAQNLKVQLMVDMVSLNTGEALADDHLLSEVQSYGNDIYEKEFSININHDSTKFLIVTHGSSQDKKQKAFADLVSTVDLKKIWNKPLMNEYENNPVKSRCCQVDTSGNLYYFFVYKKDPTETAFKGSAISVIPKNDTKETVMPLTLNPGIGLYNPSLQYVAADNSVYFTSSFKDIKTSEKRKAGIIYAKILPGTFSTPNLVTEYFTLKNQEYMECGKETEDILKQEFFAPVVKVLAGIPFVYTYINTHFMRNFRPVHYSGNIVVFKLNVQGLTEWQKMIPHATYYSYVTDNVDPTRTMVFVKEDKLCFLIADHKTNSIQDPGNFDFCKLESVSGMSGVNLLSISIDTKGTLNRTVHHSNVQEVVDAGTALIKTDKGFIVRYKFGTKEGFGRLVIK